MRAFLRMKKYVLHPGEVSSKSDGQVHYISARALAHCYGLRLEECYVVEQTLFVSPRSISVKPYTGNDEDYIHLYPRYQGDYAQYKAMLEKMFEHKQRMKMH